MTAPRHEPAPEDVEAVDADDDVPPAAAAAVGEGDAEVGAAAEDDAAEVDGDDALLELGEEEIGVGEALPEPLAPDELVGALEPRVAGAEPLGPPVDETPAPGELLPEPAGAVVDAAPYRTPWPWAGPTNCGVRTGALPGLSRASAIATLPPMPASPATANVARLAPR